MPTVPNPASRRGRVDRLSRGDVRERQILDVLEKLLAEKGFDALTMDGVAKEVGLTRSSLYFYFDSKQSAATALVNSIYQELTAPIEKFHDSLSTEELLELALDHTAALWRKHSVVMRFAAQRGQEIPEIASLWEKAMRTWTAATVAIMRRHPTKMADDRHAWALNVMVERNMWYLHSAPHTRAQEREVVAVLRDIFQAALD